MQVSPEIQDPNANRTLLRPVSRLHLRRSLLQANQASLNFAGELLSRPSEDPHGSVLRQLRQHLKKSPEELATSACLSVGQLHEIETGGQTLFYSPSLRLQAARRLARLLGTDWDEIVQGQVTAVQLMASTRHTGSASKPAGLVISLNTRVVSGSEQAPKSTVLQLVPAVTDLKPVAPALQGPQTASDPALPLAGNVLLTTAAADDAVAQMPASAPEQVAAAAGPADVQPQRNGRHWWRGLSLALVVGGAAFYAAHELGLLQGVSLPWPVIGELL